MVTAFRYAARPIYLTRLVSLGCQPQKRADILCFAEPVWVIDQRDKAERYDRTDAGNRHQAAGDRVMLGFRFHRIVEISGCLAQGRMGDDKAVGDSAQPLDLFHQLRPTGRETPGAAWPDRHLSCGCQRP